MKYSPFFAILMVAGVAAYGAAIGFGSMPFQTGLAERVGTQLMALTFFALLIERAVEVIVNNKFLSRELEVAAPVVKRKRQFKMLQSALELELQQPVPAMVDQDALATASAAKNDTIKDLRQQISMAKKSKITADQAAMPLRETLGSEKAAFAATTATILGGMVALTGTTVLSEFVVMPQTVSSGKFFGVFDQLQLFAAVDILFTALILAGGSDGIHQIVKGFLSAKSDLALS